MRLLIIALTILGGPLLLIRSTDTLAVPADIETVTNNYQHAQATTLRGKSKDPRLFPVKQKSLQNPGDVWERIRSTMQIPRPSPAQTLPDSAPAISMTSSGTRINPEATLQAGALAEKIAASRRIRQPITASAPLYNYTPYGRLKFNSAVASRTRGKQR